MLQRTVTTKNSFGKDIVDLILSSTKVHMLHLKTDSYAAHMAMGDFYSAIPDLVDSVAEQYQGVTGTLLTYPSSVNISFLNTASECISYLSELYDLCNRMQVSCKYSEIINTLDEIKSLINSTKYKLIFLK